MRNPHVIYVSGHLYNGMRAVPGKPGKVPQWEKTQCVLVPAADLPELLHKISKDKSFKDSTDIAITPVDWLADGKGQHLNDDTRKAILACIHYTQRAANGDDLAGLEAEMVRVSDAASRLLKDVP